MRWMTEIWWTNPQAKCSMFAVHGLDIREVSPPRNLTSQWAIICKLPMVGDLTVLSAHEVSWGVYFALKHGLLIVQPKARQLAKKCLRWTQILTILVNHDIYIYTLVYIDISSWSTSESHGTLIMFLFTPWLCPTMPPFIGLGRARWTTAFNSGSFRALHWSRRDLDQCVGGWLVDVCCRCIYVYINIYIYMYILCVYIYIYIFHYVFIWIYILYVLYIYYVYIYIYHYVFI